MKAQPKATRSMRRPSLECLRLLRRIPRCHAPLVADDVTLRACLLKEKFFVFFGKKKENPFETHLEKDFNGNREIYER